MSGTILLDKDTVNFLDDFGDAKVEVKSATLSGSGKKTFVTGTKVCVEGDEKKVSVPSCLYTTNQYPVSGKGTLRIASLSDDQVARKMKDRGKAVLLKGSQLNAVFEVQVPAKKPPPASVSDPTPKYDGKGTFGSTNMKWEAS